MGIGDRIRDFFSRRGNPELELLESFVRNHKGVEGFVEPKTATNPTTLLLVDRVGEHARAAVRDPRDAWAFCDRLGVPVYDAAVIGYPQRLTDYVRGRGGDPDALDAQIVDLERRLGGSEGGTPPNG